MTRKATFAIAIMMALVLSSLLYSASNFGVAYSASNSISMSPAQTETLQKPQNPIYIWFFGFVGDTFYPTTELNISQQTMINAAKNLGQTLGKQNLVLATAVDEIPGENISGDMVPTIANYVSQLKHYAGAVYGRLDFMQFNLTAVPGYGDCDPWYNCPFYNQTRLYANKLGLNGVWFDHVSQYWNLVGNVTFNQMMQNLTELFPNLTFILNQTPGAIIGFVHELQGYTWANETYVTPSPGLGSLLMSGTVLQKENSYFPGHVIVHLDAEGPTRIGTNPKEPMSIFADLSSTREFSAVQRFIYNGAHPRYQNESYSFVTPILGSWTYNGTKDGFNYHGTLYNGLTTGVYERSTITGFEGIILHGSPAYITLSPKGGPVGTKIKIVGNYFDHSSKVMIKFDGAILNQTITNSAGNFSSLITVPLTVAGQHKVTATDGNNTLSKGFDVKPKIVEHPGRGQPGKFVVVNGTGFAADSSVTIAFNGTDVAYASTGSQGTFTASYWVPDLPPGRYYVTATDAEGNSATKTFEIT